MKKKEQNDKTISNSTPTAFFRKESDQPFFSNSYSPFSDHIPVKDKDNDQQETGYTTDSIKAKSSGPLAGDGHTSNRNNFFSSGLTIQRKCAACEKEEETGIQKKEEGDAPAPATPSPDTASAAPATAPAAPAIPAARFIVEDNVAPGAGQMRKTDFLNRVKDEVSVSVNDALSGTPFSSDVSSYISASFDQHKNKNPLELEQSIAHYEPSTAQAQSVDDLIARMKAKAYTDAKEWALSGGGVLSGAAQILGGASDAIGSAVSGIGSAVSGIASSIGSLFFKGDAGGAQATQSPQSVMQSLGKGNSIDSHSQSKMESAFGSSFSRVEVHTDSNAATLSGNMNARAFTVGNHIAFASGEHKPGTLEGDALMAHELTHVEQQRDHHANGSDNQQELEKNADETAAQAMMQQHGIIKKDANGKRISKKSKSGLKIQRCGSCKTEPTIKNAGPFEPYRTKTKEELFNFLISQPVRFFVPQLDFLKNLYDETTDEYWYAKAIIENGPEVNWPADLLTERNIRAQKSPWLNDQKTDASLMTTAGGLPVQAYFFPGQTANRALIIGGVHGSELGGIEVVNILVQRLKTGPLPYYTVILVPSLFPDNAKVAENEGGKGDNGANVGRLTKGPDTKDPNRQMPSLGKAYDASTKKDGEGATIEPENIVLLELIEKYKPSRIASVHGKHLNEEKRKESGIYADPRSKAPDAKTNEPGKALGYDSDKRLALEMAKKAAAKGARLPGNKLGGAKPNAVYPQDPQPADAGNPQPRGKGEGSKGASLGGWGATEVCDPSKPQANRPAMRVITIEVMGTKVENTDHATDKDAKKRQQNEQGIQAARKAELEGHADALQEIFLGNNEVEPAEVPCTKPITPTKP